jgi:hypothetical protein
MVLQHQVKRRLPAFRRLLQHLLHLVAGAVAGQIQPLQRRALGTRDPNLRGHLFSFVRYPG